MQFQGKTVEEAVANGLKEMGLTADDVEITVLEQGKKGILGFGAVPAKVEITEKLVKKVAEKVTEHVGISDGQRAVMFLEGLFPLLDAEVTPKLADEREKIIINLEGETAGIIGRRGELIDAVQTLAGAVANTGRRDYKRVVVDCEGYREEREETLKRVAEKYAAKAVRIGKRVRLEPMNPYERRIIHAALADSEEVTTKSEGREPARYVVITPKNAKNDRQHGERSERGGKGRYGDKRGRGRDERGGRGDRKPYPKRDLPSEATPETSGTSFNRGSSTPGYKKGGFSGFFGTYLGKADEETPIKTENEAIMPANDPSEE